MWYAFFLCLLEKGAPGAGRTRLMLMMLVSGGCWLLTLFDLWVLVAYALRFVGAGCLRSSICEELWWWGWAPPS